VWSRATHCGRTMVVPLDRVGISVWVPGAGLHYSGVSPSALVVIFRPFGLIVARRSFIPQPRQRLSFSSYLAFGAGCHLPSLSVFSAAYRSGVPRLGHRLSSIKLSGLQRSLSFRSLSSWRRLTFTRVPSSRRGPSWFDSIGFHRRLSFRAPEPGAGRHY